MMLNDVETATMEQANAMLDAADGYADDEMVWFAGQLRSAWRLRDTADDIIDRLM